MRAVATAVVVIGLVSLPAGAAQADPTTSPVDPSTAVTFPVVAFDARTVPFDARTLAIEFPQASVDGSVTEDGTVITLKTDVFFAYNKATLNSRATAALDRAAARLTELNATTVRVNGYTDSKGSAAYNKNLSKRRADAVLAALKQRLAALKGSVRANGERHPVATNKTAKGRALNRRVTITVTG